MKKVMSFIAVAAICATITGCAGEGNKITVISREDGSGTRGAFTELTGVMSDDTDNTVASAEVSNSTSVVLTSVAGNQNAIGYVSLGSVNDTIKTLSIDGTQPSVDAVKDGSYSIARPFNVCVKEDVSELSNDFISFIMSDSGQAIIEEEGYISATAGESYTSSNMSGKITLAGSTSVSPVMDVLADAYMGLNSGVEIEIQQSGSSAGVQAAIEGVCDIGMASRELKSSEIEAGVEPIVIAIDGIAVIVNSENEISNLTIEQLKNIYVGEVTDWNDVK